MKLWLALAAIITACPAAFADTELPFGDADACNEGPLQQFGRYIGDWAIEDEQLSKDGTEWLPGDGARWIFVCLGNGTAIQDFWLPADGKVGTNLRTWNAATKNWDIAWAVDTLPGFAHIQARENEDGSIVMHYKSPLPDPPRRITFYPPDDGGWNWKLEFMLDGENWTEVYRIRATPYE